MRRNWRLTFCALTALMILFSGCRGKAESENKLRTDQPAGAGRSGVVTLSEESLKLAGIDFATVKRGRLPMTIRVPGRISFNLNQTAKVTSTFAGHIAKMNEDIGAVVQKNDVMALVDSPELLNKPLELKAPISGQVIERHGTVGEAVDQSTVLYTVSDLRSVWGIAEIKEKDIAAVRVGQQASLQVLAYPQESFAGKIVLIGNEVEEKTRTVEARIEVDNSGGKLKPGMFADVELVTSVLDNVIVIPDEALQTLEDQQIVFVAADANEFTKRVVTVGRGQNGHAEIVDGLQEGERVVTKGSFILKSELLNGELGEE
ncbi:MAG: efflux RND transporter periplasmic adaptor subunit [candidate division Zixibacteria bacterium]|nr:efflux RND transporter periplasmic adaptor subunit [candidate division Zixibacteria bacterium]